jgi:hypothetical protein
MTQSTLFFQVRFTVLSIFLLVSFSSCGCYRHPLACPNDEFINVHRSHWLYQVVPRHRCQIAPWDVGHWIMWSCFGNDDDGIFGEEPTAEFKPECEPSFAKALAWTLRNPFHNFCFYVIGSANRCNSEFTVLRITPDESETMVYRPEASTVFAGHNSSFYLAFHGGKPFISSRIVWSETRESRFYLGWRCRGNFGLRCNLFAKRKEQE